VSPSPPDDELLQLYRDWFDAIGRNDGAWFERHLADDFVYLTLDGEVWDKRKLIEVNTSVTGTALTILDFSTREIAAGISLVLGRYSARAVERTSGGIAISAAMRAALSAGVELRWSGLWRRAPEGRQAFLHHVTPVDVYTQSKRG